MAVGCTTIARGIIIHGCSGLLRKIRTQLEVALIDISILKIVHSTYLIRWG